VLKSGIMFPQKWYNVPSQSFRIAVSGRQTPFFLLLQPNVCFLRCCSSSTTWRCSCNSSYWTPIRPSPIAGGLSSLFVTWRAMDLAKLSSKVGRSVDQSVCVCDLVFLFCVVDRPGFLFLGFLASWFVFMAGWWKDFHLRFWYVVFLHLVCLCLVF
jgi:hypothetical protein